MPDEVDAVTAQRAAADGQLNLVLAVDDNPDAIVLIKAALQNTPFTVVGMQAPLQAMELVMPDLNGWQILHQLKANPSTSSIPVIMLTVLTEPATGYVLGADDYLIKPFKRDVLLNTLRTVVASQKASSQADKRKAQLVER